MTAQATPVHRISVLTAHLRDLATSVVDVPVWSMSPTEAGQTLVELARLRAQLDDHEARVAAHADRVGVGDEVAASSTAAWFAHATGQTHASAKKIVQLGHDLDEHALVREALAAGRLVADQARVVIAAVEALPDDLDPDVCVKAEAHLAGLAAEHDARALARLGAGILEVVAPEVADSHEARLLEKQEARAEAKTWFRCYDDGHGSTHGEFTIPTATAGATLKKVLWALAAPKHVQATQGAELTWTRPTPERLGQAFCEFITRLPTKKLPKTGALNATVVVTIGLDPLTGALHETGVLDTGQKISATMARKLACQAGIIPAVLDGESVPLDLGRKKRLHSDYQRIAMHLRDGGCAAEGCDRTTGLHAHHKTSWAQGGETSLDNGITLCGWHHHRAHDTRYRTTYLPTGKVAFHRRT